MKSANRLIVAILIVTALAVGFWMLLLSPKQKEADVLSAEVDSLQVTLAQANNEVAVAEAAKREFPDDYRQLVVLGEAVPEGDETASLLVELNRLATSSKVDFESIQLAAGGEAAVPEAAVAPPAVETPAPEASGSGVPAAATVPPTEATASLMPLGASIGPAGLAVMPYTLSFTGDFFQIADFIHRIDKLVETKNAKVGVEGRLVTIDGFALTADTDEEGSGGDDNRLSASFTVTTYVTPPDQGVTVGASTSEPAPISESSASPEPEASEAGEAQ
jgi:Tfp pilus assembly protein PilO